MYPKQTAVLMREMSPPEDFTTPASPPSSPIFLRNPHTRMVLLCTAEDEQVCCVHVTQKEELITEVNFKQRVMSS